MNKFLVVFCLVLLPSFSWALAPVVGSGDGFINLLEPSGVIVSQGLNGSGQLGDGTTVGKSTFSPIAASGIIKVQSGLGHGAALTSSGQVLVWGANAQGELADGTLVSRSVPDVAQIWSGRQAINLNVPPPYPTYNLMAGPISNIVDISVGKKHTLAVTGGGEVFAWGENSRGQIGDGLTVAPIGAVKVLDAVTGLPLSGIIKVSAGGAFSLALSDVGRVYAWGDNAFGQLGFSASSVAVTKAKLVPNLFGIKDISAGERHSLSLSSTGQVYAWGDNTFGQLGAALQAGVVFTWSPVSPMATVVSIAAGSFHTLAVKAGGDVYAWGDNAFGQLGVGNVTRSWTPVLIKKNLVATTFSDGYEVFASASSSSSYATSFDGMVYAWGGTVASRPSLTLGVNSKLPSPIVSGGVAKTYVYNYPPRPYVAKGIVIVDGASPAQVQVVHGDANVGSQLTYSVSKRAISGQASIGADGVATYVPSGKFLGLDSFTVAVSDNIDSGRVVVPVSVSDIVPPVLFLQEGGFPYVSKVSPVDLYVEPVERMGLPQALSVDARDGSVLVTGTLLNVTNQANPVVPVAVSPPVVDTYTKFGNYILRFDSVDAAGNAAATLNVNVKVWNSPPVITVRGGSSVNLTFTPPDVYQDFNDPGAVVEDIRDGSSVITAAKFIDPYGTVTTTFVPNGVGVYQAVYESVDSGGVAATPVTLPINVIEKANVYDPTGGATCLLGGGKNLMGVWLVLFFAALSVMRRGKVKVLGT